METRSQKWHKLKTKRWVLEIKLEATSTKNVHDHKLSNFLPDSKHNFVNKVMKWGGTSQLGPFCESVSLGRIHKGTGRTPVPLWILQISSTVRVYAC